MFCVFTSVFTQSTKYGSLWVSRWDICIAIEPHVWSSWFVKTSRWIFICWTTRATSKSVSQFGTFIFADIFCNDYCIAGTILAHRNCKGTYTNIAWTIECQYGSYKNIISLFIGRSELLTNFCHSLCVGAAMFVGVLWNKKIYIICPYNTYKGCKMNNNYNGQILS